MKVIATRLVGAVLATAGVVLCLSAAAIGTRGIAWQSRHGGSFGQITARAGRVNADPDRFVVDPNVIMSMTADVREDATRPAPTRGRAVARLRIPRVGLDVVVAEGTDPATLRRGPGHLEGSALPGESDNCIIAGHRDGPFRSLGDLRVGDRVEVSGEMESGVYRVESIEVVDQSETDSLDPTDEAVLTLITCYPFDHLGPTPRRLIVRAALKDGPIAFSP